MALPTLASWAATEGKAAIVLTYAPTDWSAPAKFGIVAAVTPTIAGWLPTLGEKAIALRYDATNWTAPAKFGLVQAPAAPTIAGSIPTIGLPSISLKYAAPEVVSQISPTLATLPIGIALSEPAVKAQPQRYSAVDWTAPFDFFEQQGPFICADKGFTVTQSMLADGVTTTSSMIALNITIVALP
jgi:hypothetical protein